MHRGKQSSVHGQNNQDFVREDLFAATIPLLGKQSGANFVILNNEPTEMDQFADLIINASISETFDAIL